MNKVRATKTIIQLYAVMVDDGFHDTYPTKMAAKRAAASLREHGLKARIQKVPADLRRLIV